MVSRKSVEDFLTSIEKYEIRGTSADALVGTFVSILYVNRFEPISIPTLIKEIGSFWKQRLMVFFKKVNYPTFFENAPLLTVMSDRPHIHKMSAIIGGNLNTSFSRFFCYSPEIKLGTNDHVRVNYLSIPTKGNSTNEGRVFRQVVREFKQFLRLHNLSPLRVFPFSYHLQRQLGWVDFFEHTFQNGKPSFILTEYDRFNEITALISAAKSVGIPTITQVHGLLNVRYAYAPLVADHVFCWGEGQRETFRSWGVHPDQITVTGAVQLSNKRSSKIHLDFVPAFHERNTKVLVLATNPTEQIRENLISFFCDVLRLLPENWVGLVRLHPSESPKDYQPYVSLPERVFILNPDKVSYEESLASADAVAVFNSAFAIDALLVGIPTVQMNVSPDFPGRW